MLPLSGNLKNKIREIFRYRLFRERKFIDEVFSVERTFDLIKRQGIDIRSAVDVGANTGQWAKNFLCHFPEVRLLSIEANPDNLPELRTVNPDSIQACLAETSGDIRTFYLPNPVIETNNTGASLYKELLPAYEDAVRLELETSTLDGFNRHFDLIKLDVQGAELDVLKGGISTLANAKFVMIELSLSRYNHSSPLAAEVIAYLHDVGFIFLSVNEVLFHNSKPIQLDCCFVQSRLAHLANLDA
ncbi:FkbM family methyltransferase [Synechococcus sp. AH-736-G20]|nr:FkbM family methyltransferase [Synechococcus sp. AH-736-G20]